MLGIVFAFAALFVVLPLVFAVLVMAGAALSVPMPEIDMRPAFCRLRRRSTLRLHLTFPVRTAKIISKKEVRPPI